MSIVNTGSKQARPQGRWTKGVSGNARGRPPGRKNNATLIAQDLMDESAEKLAKKAVAMALQGDTVAMRLVMDRLVPPRKHRGVDFELPPIECLEDVPVAAAAILAAASKGLVPIADAEALMRVVDGFRRSVEAAEIERRLEALEARYVKGS